MGRSREGYLWAANQISEGLETDAIAHDTLSVKDSYDVVVIGAGFAGLIAARDLCQHSKLSTLLIEGRDRIGGRTWTANALGEQFEMGGTWVHWHQPNVYSELQRYGLHRNLKPSVGFFAPERSFYKPNGSAIQTPAVDEGQLQCIASKFFQVDGHTSRTLMPYPHDPLRQPAPWRDYDHMTVRQRLDQLTDFPQSDRDYFETQINTLGGAPGEGTGFVEFLRWYALSGHSMALFTDCAGVYKIGKGGMTSFANAILKEYSGDRIFNTVVRKIQQKNSAVYLNVSDGRLIRAEAVVSTIPLNCLSDIEFSPPLSTLRQTAVKTGHINKSAKIHFKLSKAEPAWFGYCDHGPDHPYSLAFLDHNATKESGRDGSYCVSFGYNGRLMDPKDDKEIIEGFRRSFNENAQVEAYITHDWMNDPLAKGVWCCWNSNTMSKNLEELQKPHDRVLFASADWADGWRGFVDGAIERGRIAAREIVDVRRESHY